jgi:hypothetical protein
MSPAHIILPILFYSGLNYGDYKSSVDGLHRGAVEINPIVNSVGPAPVKIVSSILLSGLDIALQQNKKNRAGLWTYRIAVGGIFTAVIIRNSRINKR